MARKAEDLYREALNLSEDEREELIRLLTGSVEEGQVDPGIEKAWIEEAERRHKGILDGTERLIPGDVVMRELRDLVSK